IGAIAIGSVFTQLLFENVDNSTFIYVGWLVVGAITFVAYRRFRRLWLWEPLAAPPLPERPVHHVSIERPPPAARVKVERRHAAPVAEIQTKTVPKTVPVAATSR